MHCLVLADRSRARVFTANELFEELDEVMTLIHPESRLHARDLVSDQQSRLAPGIGADPHTPLKDVEAQQFAREVAHYVAGRVDTFERLVLVAPPRFLGFLKAELRGQAEKKLVATVSKEWTEVAAHELRGRLLKALPETLGAP